MIAEKNVQTLKNFIGGKWVASSGDKMEAVPNPATGEPIAYVPFSTHKDVDDAVQAAKEAFASWKKVPVPRRARILFRYQ